MRTLARLGKRPLGEWLSVGPVTVTTVLARDTADAHFQNVAFLVGGRLVASDGIPATTHYTVNLCRGAGDLVITDYLLNTGGAGYPIDGCPPPTTVHVRWRLVGTHVSRLDPLPRECRGR